MSGNISSLRTERKAAVRQASGPVALAAAARAFAAAALLAAVWAPAPARASGDEKQDFAVMMTDLDIRTEAGFDKPTAVKGPYLSVWRVKGSVQDEGKQTWYGLILREEKTSRQVEKKGWVLKLPKESDPLLKEEVPVFRHPGDQEPPRLVKTKRLSRTGTVRNDGAWTEVKWTGHDDRVDEQLGFIAASDVALEARTTREKVDEKIAAVRAHPKWTQQMVKAVFRGDVREGFPRDAVLLSLGEPEIKVDLDGHRERFLYRVSAMGSVEITLLRGYVDNIRRIEPAIDAKEEP